MQTQCAIFAITVTIEADCDERIGLQIRRLSPTLPMHAIHYFSLRRPILWFERHNYNAGFPQPLLPGEFTDNCRAYRMQ